MNTQHTNATHPSILRTNAALEVVGARQRWDALPAVAQSLLALGLSLAAIAAVAFG